MTGTASPGRYRIFFEELRRLGYQEGLNLVVERYSGIGKIGHLDELLQSAAASKPDVILVLAMEGVLKATPLAVPIVEIGLDPIAFGLTSNLAHPDHNITGVSMIAGSELYAKHLELLRQASPAASIATRAQQPGKPLPNCHHQPVRRSRDAE